VNLEDRVAQPEVFRVIAPLLPDGRSMLGHRSILSRSWRHSLSLRSDGIH
jgi:hypothetical protein